MNLYIPCIKPIRASIDLRRLFLKRLRNPANLKSSKIIIIRELAKQSQFSMDWFSDSGLRLALLIVRTQKKEVS
jgi:hypothetical protein